MGIRNGRDNADKRKYGKIAMVLITAIGTMRCAAKVRTDNRHEHDTNRQPLRHRCGKVYTKLGGGFLLHKARPQGCSKPEHPLSAHQHEKHRLMLSRAGLVMLHGSCSLKSINIALNTLQYNASQRRPKTRTNVVPR